MGERDGSRVIFGGDWEDLGEERISRWTDKHWHGPRRVSVKIESWVGISIGARHTYIRVEEEENQWWCEKNNCWQRIWQDSENGGFKLEASVYDDKQAIKVAKNFLRLMVGNNRDGKWQVDWQGPGKPRGR